jgi:hypothetical protein
MSLYLMAAGVERRPASVDNMLPITVQSTVDLLQSTDVAIVFVCAFVVAYVGFKLGIGHQPEATKSFRQPPRLKSLPVIGSIPYLPAGLRHMHTYFMEKLPTMGPVIGFNIMSRSVVSCTVAQFIVLRPTFQTMSLYACIEDI